MKIFVQNLDVSGSLSEKVRYYASRLKNEKLLIIKSFDHLEHIAAYLAWQDVLGKILVVAPLLPESDLNNLVKGMDAYEHVDDGVFFHTSGTTGFPKIIQHGRTQFYQFDKMNENAFGFNSKSNHLTLSPAFTSGFWHIAIPGFCRIKYNLTISSRETLQEDINSKKHNYLITAVNLFSYLKSTNAPVNFDSFDIVGIGASSVTDNHMEYLFSKGATTTMNVYGTTETGTPVLQRKVTKTDPYYSYSALNPTIPDAEVKLVNGELWVKSPSLCENFKSFAHDDEWRRTGDLWEEKDGLIKFVGRNDDLVKTNGYVTNLLEIENWIENNSDLGECLTKVRSFGGNDYIELFHTKNSTKDSKETIVAQMSKLFVPCQVPKKFKFVEQLPKNPLGKKQRHLL